MRYSLSLGVVCALLISASVSQAAVVSWLSESNSLVAAQTPGDLALAGTKTGGDTGRLYIWVDNTVKLNSLAYDVVSSDTAKIKITANMMDNPLVFGALNRWDPPANQGAIDAEGNLRNMYGIAVTAQGLNPATIAGDAGYNLTAGAALAGWIDYAIQGAACTVGCTNVPVTLQIGNGTFGTFEGADPAVTTNHLATIMVAMGDVVGVAPVVGDVNHATTLLNEIVGPLMPMDTAPGTAPVTWSALLNPTYTPMFGAPAGALGLHHQPMWDPAMQKFNWDTGGSSRGRYTWDVTASNAIGMDTGTITVDVRFIPEPASLTLVGLAMIGLAGLIRRRG
jgi:hypothetical protein